MAIWTNDGTTLADFNDGSPYIGGAGNTVGIADGQIKITIVTPGDEVGVRYNAGAQAARYLEFDYTIASDAVLNDSHTVMHAWSRDYATDLLELRVTPNGGGYSVRVYDPVAMVSGTPSTMLTKGFKYRIKLAISATEATLTIDNRAPIVFSGRAWSSPQMVLGAMSWGQYFTETLFGTQYFDNFSLQESPPLDSGLVAVPRPVNVADKRYIAKVSKADGTYIGVWKDIKDDLRFTQQINTPGTTTTVQLARSAENTIEKRSPLTNHLDAAYTDHLGQPYFVTSRTSNSIGPDTDVENGHLVDIFAVYGRFEPLTDHMGRAYTDSLGNPYMVSVGAPLGRPVFRGKIIDYGARYGTSVGVTVTIASHGMELTKGEVIKSGSATTVTYSTTPIESIIKSILDTNPGRITYDASSISSTGVLITSKFVLNTKLEGIKSAFDQTAAGWYWYGSPANNLLYLRPRSAEADHVFYLGKHLNDVDIKKSAEDLRNRIYFVGGDSGSGPLYRVYEDSAAIAQHGLGVHRITDRRFTQPDSARRYAEKIMSRYARPIYTSTVVISAADYDIENIQIGQNVGFRNFGNFVDEQVLQIVSLQYEPTRVTLELGEILDDQRSIIADMSEDLLNEQYQELPTIPS